MALNYIVSYLKNATSRLHPAIELATPQIYGGESLRLTIEMVGVGGKLVFEPRYGAQARYVGELFHVEGTALAINDLLSTLRYASTDDNDPTQVRVFLYRYVGTVAVSLEQLDSGVITFKARGFAQDEIPPYLEFSPVWITPSGDLKTSQGSDQFVEGNAVNLQLSGVVSSTLSGIDVPHFDNKRVVGIESGTVSGVYINGQTSSFTQGIDYTEINDPIKNTDVVEVRLNEPMQYSVNYGALPSGLSLSSFGVITGTIAPLRNAKIGEIQRITFGVRVKDQNDNYRDRQFTMKVVPVTDTQQNPEFVDPAPPSGAQYIGLYTRGAPISYVIQTTAPDGVPGVLAEVETTVPVTEEFAGLPRGVTLNSNGIISGVIDPSTERGDHYFGVTLTNARNELVDTRQFYLRVTSPSGPLEPLRFVRWTTPAGNIGSFMEGDVCPIGVKAYATTGEQPQYRALSPLPPGININEQDGSLEGVFSHVPTESVIRFTIRAYVGDTFVDREFAITVSPRYASAGAVNVFFKMRLNESRPMSANYVNYISSSDYFRVGDPNFGELKEPMIYVIGGIKKAQNDGEGPNIDDYPNPVDYVAAAIRNSNFGSPVTVRLGEHKVGYAKIGTTTVYEVLYREVIDPLDRAGGFTRDTRGKPIRTPVKYPQGPGYIYPSSIKNLRYDLSLQVGFDAYDSSLNNIPGRNGPENLPLWMKSPQVGNRQNTVLGFVPAVVVAYLRPGVGQRIADRLNTQRFPEPTPTDDPNPLVHGHEVKFDQYYLVFNGETQATTFDITTTFDGGDTTFDLYASQEGKYQRMKPSGEN